MCGYRVTDLDTKSFARLLADPEAVLGAAGVKRLKGSSSSVVAELPGNRILKRIPVSLLPSFVRRSAMLRPTSLAMPSASAACRPLARSPPGTTGRHDYLLVDKVPDALHLRGFVEMLAGKPMAERNARLWAILDELGRLVRRLHEWQFSHRDLKAANLLVSPVGSAMASRGSARGGGGAATTSG